MKQFEDINRKQWQALVAQAEKNLNAYDPSHEDATIYYANRHIKYLEFHVAHLARTLDNFVSKASTPAEQTVYVTEQIEIERQLLEIVK